MGLDSFVGVNPRNKGEAFEGPTPVAGGSPGGLRSFLAQQKSEETDLAAEEKQRQKAFEGGKKEVYESAGVSTYTDPAEGIQPKITLDEQGVQRVERSPGEFTAQRRLPTGELVDEKVSTDKYGNLTGKTSKPMSRIVAKQADSLDPRFSRDGIYEEYEDPRQVDSKGYKFLGNYEQFANAQDQGIRDVARKGLSEQNKKPFDLLNSELASQAEELRLKEDDLRNLETASKTTGESVIFDGRQITPEESAQKRLELGQQRNDIKRQQIALHQIHKQSVAIDLLRQAKERALSEGRRPADDPIVKSLTETYKTLGRETPEEAFMASASKDISTGGGTLMVEGAEPNIQPQQASAYYKTAGADLRASQRIEQEKASMTAELSKMSVKAQQAYDDARKTILPAAARKQTIKQLVEISNKELEDAKARWGEMTPQEKAEFNSRFEGRRKAIERLGEEYKSLEPAALKASESVDQTFKSVQEGEKTLNENLQKKSSEIIQEANTFAKAQSERASASIRDEYIKKQASFQSMAQKADQLASSGDDAGMVKLAQEYVSQGGDQKDADQILKAYGSYKKDNQKRGWFLNSLASFMRAPLVASQESAAGIFQMSANSLRAKASGRDDVSEAMGPAGWISRVLPSMDGNLGVSTARIAIDAAGQKILDKIYQTKAAKPFVEYIADWMDESAQAAKGNIASIKSTMPVDPQFESGTWGGFLKGVGDYAWTALPYIALKTGGIGVGMATNAGRLYTEAREDQEQAYQAKLAQFSAGKLKEEPQRPDEHDAHIAALRYAGLGGFIDTVSDVIGMKLAAGVLKGAAKLVGPKELGGFFKRTAMQIGEKKVPIWMAPPLAGATEFGAEGSQRLILNALAQKLENWDPNRPWNEGAFNEAMMGFLVGFALPVIGGVGGSVYKKTVVIPSMLSDNEGLDRMASQYQNLSADVIPGGWRQYADIVGPPQAAENEQFSLAAKEPFSIQNELRGTGVQWAIMVGQKIDADLSRINSSIGQTADPMQGKILRLKRNDLLLQRYNLIQAMQADAGLRFSLQQEIGQLPAEPMSRGEMSIQQAALAVAKFSIGAPLTDVETKGKVGGTKLFQQTEDGKTIVSPAFMRFLGGKARTLESLVASNQNLLDENAPAQLGQEPPKLDEVAPADEIRAKKEELARSQMASPEAQTPAERAPKTTTTWAVEYKKGKAGGTFTIEAENEDRARMQAIQRLKSEGAKNYSIGVVRPAEQQDLVGEEPLALLSTNEQQRARVAGVANPYMRRLEGKNPKERYLSARNRFQRFAGEVRSIYGIGISLKEDSNAKKAFRAGFNQDGDISLTINPRMFVALDGKSPEYTNRAVNEEFRHMADFVASVLKAREAGRTDYLQFYNEERSRLYRSIFEASKQDGRILEGLMSSASVYMGDKGPPMKEGGYTAEEFMQWAEENRISDFTLMGELVRQLGQKSRLTESSVEVINAQKGGGVLASVMQTIKDYLRSVLRAIQGIRRGLRDASPEVADELDGLIQSINDVLEMREPGGRQEAQPTLDNATTRRLRDAGFSPEEISAMSPEDARQRLIAPSPAPSAQAAQTKGLKSTNTRKTEYGVTRYDLEVVPLNSLNDMAGTELQLRSRQGDAAYASKIAEIGRDWDKDGAASTDTTELDTGPITVIEAKDNPYAVSQQGFDIVAGHGRKGGYEMASDERVADYANRLKAKYPDLAGKVDEIIASGQKPVLVRKIDWNNTKNPALGSEKQQLRRIARDANLGTGNENNAEIALADALEIRDDPSLSLPKEVLVNGVPSLLNQDGSPAGQNDEILEKWLKIFSSDRNLYENGVYQPAFEGRIRRAILAFVFAPENENGEMLLNKQTFDTINMLVSPTIARNNGLETFRQGLEKASVSLFNVKRDFKKYENELGEEARMANPLSAIQNSIADYLAYRAERDAAASKSGNERARAMVSLANYEDYVSQSKIFGSISPMQAMVLIPVVREGRLSSVTGVAGQLATIDNAHGIKGSPERVAAFLANYSEFVASIFRERGETMLPGMETRFEPKTNLNLIRLALDKAGAIYPEGSKPPAPIFPGQTQTMSELMARVPDFMFPGRRALSLRARTPDVDLFESSEEPESEDGPETGATEESIKNAYLIAQEIAPMEGISRARITRVANAETGEEETTYDPINEEGNRRIRPGGKIITYLINKASSSGMTPLDRFFARGYGEEQFREIAYDKIIDVLSKSETGKQLSKDFLNTRLGATQQDINLFAEARKAFVQRIIRNLLAGGNKNPSLEDVTNAMTEADNKLGFEQRHISGAREEIRLNNFLMRAIENHIRKLVGNYDDQGRSLVVTSTEARAMRPTEIRDEEDTEGMVERKFVNPATGNELDERAAQSSNLQETLLAESGTAAETMARFLGPDIAVIQMRVNGMSFQDMAEELGLEGFRPDNLARSRFEDAYGKVLVAIDAIYAAKKNLESKETLTEAEEDKLDDYNKFLSGKLGRGQTFQNIAEERAGAQQAIRQSSGLTTGQMDLGLEARVPDLPPARLFAKYSELRDKIKSGEFEPKDLDMFERIESMAIKFNWPIPVQLRLFDIPNLLRRATAERSEVAKAVQDEFDFGGLSLDARTPDIPVYIGGRIGHSGKAFAKFYSRLIDAIETKMPSKATIGQVMDIATKTPGVRAEELRWVDFEGLVEEATTESGPNPENRRVDKDLLIQKVKNALGNLFFVETLTGPDAKYSAYGTRGMLTRGTRDAPSNKRGQDYAERVLRFADPSSRIIDRRPPDLWSRVSEQKKAEILGNGNYVIAEVRPASNAMLFISGEQGNPRRSAIMSEEAWKKLTEGYTDLVETSLGEIGGRESIRASQAPSGLGVAPIFSSEQLKEQFQKNYTGKYAVISKTKVPLETLPRYLTGTISEGSDFERALDYIESTKPQGGSPYLQMFKLELAKSIERGDKWIGFSTGDSQIERYNRTELVDRIRILPFKTGRQIDPTYSRSEESGQHFEGKSYIAHSRVDRFPAVSDNETGTLLDEIQQDNKRDTPFGGTKSNNEPTAPKEEILYAIAAYKDGRIIKKDIVDGKKLSGLVGKPIAEKAMAITPLAGADFNFIEPYDDLMRRAAEVGVEESAFSLTDEREHKIAQSRILDLQGENLEFGSQKLRNLYDKTIYQQISKYVSKWGGKIKKDDVSTGPVEQYEGPIPDVIESVILKTSIDAALDGLTKQEARLAVSVGLKSIEDRNKLVQAVDTDDSNIIKATLLELGFDEKYSTDMSTALPLIRGTDFKEQALSQIYRLSRDHRKNNGINNSTKFYPMTERIEHSFDNYGLIGRPFDIRRNQEAVVFAKSLREWLNELDRTGEWPLSDSGFKFQELKEQQISAINKIAGFIRREKNRSNPVEFPLDQNTPMAEDDIELNGVASTATLISENLLKYNRDARFLERVNSRGDLDSSWPGAKEFRASLLGGRLVVKPPTKRSSIYRIDITPEMAKDISTSGQALFSRMPDMMTDAELQQALDGDWITNDEIQAALRDESVGERRGLVDYGNTPEASAVIRASQEASPRPEPFTDIEAASKASGISKERIFNRLANLEEDETLTKDEDYAAQRELNQLAYEAFQSGDDRQINEFLYLQRQYDKSGTAAGRSLQGRKPFNPEDTARKAVLAPITAIDRRDLEVEARNKVAEISASLAVAEDGLAQQKTRARAAYGTNLPKEWADYIAQQEAAIAQMQADIADGGVRAAEKSILERQAKKADQSLQKAGKSLAGIEQENMQKKLRTGQTAGQMLESIKDTQLRDAVQLYLLGYSVKDIEAQTGLKNARNKIKLAILKGLRPEADRRFQRVLEQVRAGKMTRKQLMQAIKKHSEGQGLLAKMPDDPDKDGFSEEEARQLLYDAFGLNTDNLENAESDPLFGYDDPVAAGKISSLISEGINGPASWGKIASDLFSSNIFSGGPSLVANISTIPFAKLSVPIHLFVEALTNYYRGGVRGVTMTETAFEKVPQFDEEGNPAGTRLVPREVDIGTPYKTLGEAIQGGATEALRAFKELGWLGFSKEAWARATDAFKSETIQFGVEQGIVKTTDIRLREAGVLEKSIPGTTGKVLRTGTNILLAGDEYNKTMRVRAYVGAFAYRLGKARGLSGGALNDYIESELADKTSLTWRLAVDRTLRDTFTQRLSIRGDEELLTPQPMWQKAKGMAKSLRDYQSFGELAGLVPEALTMINMELGRAANRVARTSSIKVFGRALSPAELALRFAQSFLILIRSPYNIARASAAYSPFAMANVAMRAKRGSAGGRMNAFEYNTLSQRHSEALLGITGLAALFVLAEGDDDDDKKTVLITGSGGVNTKFNNPSASVIIRGLGGGLVIPYGRYEPVSGLAYVIDAARAMKQAMRGRQTGGEAVGAYVMEFFRYPFTKTFAKAVRDLGKLSGWGTPTDTGKYKGYDVMRERLSSLLIPNFFKRLFEPGALTFGDESWDTDRMTGWGPGEMAGWVNSFLPGLPALTGNEDLSLPPRYKADLKPKEREVTITEAGLKYIGVKERASRLAGGITKGLLPDGLAFMESKKSSLDRFVTAYNSRFPQTRYQPRAPSRFIQMKDKDGISTNEEMTPREYNTMLALAAKYAGSRVDNVLTEERISNPTEATRKMVDSIREDAISRARQAVRNARRAKEKKSVEPALVR